MDLDIPENDKPQSIEVPKLERQNLNLTESEFRSELPHTSKLAYSTLQKNRLVEALEKSRIPAVADFIRLAGIKGEIQTRLQGMALTIKAGANKHIVANPENVGKVKEAYQKPFDVLEEALNAGVAIRRETKDFNIVLHKPETPAMPKDNTIIETLLQNATDRKLELASKTISEGYPTLVSSIHCQIQKKRLEVGIKKIRPKAKEELETYQDTNINTVVNNQSVRISTFNKHPIEILPGNPEWDKRLSDAQKIADKELKSLLAAGKAKEEITYYLQASIGKK